MGRVDPADAAGPPSGAVDASTTEPWKSLLAANTPGGSPIRVPILITQGDADELVRSAATTDFVRRSCAAGERVTFRTYKDIDHGLIGERTVPFLLTWLAEVQGAQSPDPTCTTTADGAPNAVASSAGTVPVTAGG